MEIQSLCLVGQHSLPILVQMEHIFRQQCCQVSLLSNREISLWKSLRTVLGDGPELPLYPRWKTRGDYKLIYLTPSLSPTDSQVMGAGPWLEPIKMWLLDLAKLATATGPKLAMCYTACSHSCADARIAPPLFLPCLRLGCGAGAIWYLYYDKNRQVLKSWFV